MWEGGYSRSIDLRKCSDGRLKAINAFIQNCHRNSDIQGLEEIQIIMPSDICLIFENGLPTKAVRKGL